MVQHQPAPFVLRPRRGLLLVAPALVAALALGCGHRRSSMRPVYMTPAPAPAAATCTGCSTATTPGATTTIVPQSSAPPLISPGTATIDDAAAPASSATVPMGRPGTPGSQEPGFQPELAPAGPSSTVPSLQPPASTPSGGSKTGLRSPSGRLRQAGLRQELAPFVNDPGDLFQPPKAERPWKYIVLHHSARPSGSYDEIDREHREAHGWNGCGYHFIIGNGTGSPDGQIEVARRWVDQKHGIHCRDGKSPDACEYGIGICLVGDLDQAPPTPKQVAAAKALVAYLGRRYQIPAEHVGTHATLAASPTACPGKHFPTQAILGSRSLASR